MDGVPLTGDIAEFNDNPIYMLLCFFFFLDKISFKLLNNSAFYYYYHVWAKSPKLIEIKPFVYNLLGSRSLDFWSSSLSVTPGHLPPHSAHAEATEDTRDLHGSPGPKYSIGAWLVWLSGLSAAGL